MAQYVQHYSLNELSWTTGEGAMSRGPGQGHKIHIVKIYVFNMYLICFKAFIMFVDAQTQSIRHAPPSGDWPVSLTLIAILLPAFLTLSASQKLSAKDD